MDSYSNQRIANSFQRQQRERGISVASSAQRKDSLQFETMGSPQVNKQTPISGLKQQYNSYEITLTAPLVEEDQLRRDQVSVEQENNQEDQINDEEEELEPLEFEFLNVNLLSLIQPDSWFNIPICIVKAFKALIEHSQLQDAHMQNHSTAFRDYQRQQKNYISALERRISDNAYRMHCDLDMRDEKMHERMHKHSVDIEKLGKLIDNKTVTLNKKIDSEVSGIKGQVQLSDKNRIKFQENISSEFSQLSDGISAPVKDLEAKFEARIAGLIEDNLLIPGLVGETLPYKNLKAYLTTNHSIVSVSLNDFASKLQQMELDLRRENSNGLHSLKNELSRLNLEHKKVIAESKEELKNYSLTLVGHVRQEIEKSNSDQKSLQARIQHLQEILSTLNVEIRDIKDTQQRQIGKVSDSVDTMGKQTVELLIKKEMDLFRTEQRNQLQKQIKLAMKNSGGIQSTQQDENSQRNKHHKHSQSKIGNDSSSSSLPPNILQPLPVKLTDQMKQEVTQIIEQALQNFKVPVQEQKVFIEQKQPSIQLMRKAQSPNQEVVDDSPQKQYTQENLRYDTNTLQNSELSLPKPEPLDQEEDQDSVLQNQGIISAVLAAKSRDSNEDQLSLVTVDPYGANQQLDTRNHKPRKNKVHTLNTTLASSTTQQAQQHNKMLSTSINSTQAQKFKEAYSNLSKKQQEGGVNQSMTIDNEDTHSGGDSIISSTQTKFFNRGSKLNNVITANVSRNYNASMTVFPQVAASSTSSSNQFNMRAASLGGGGGVPGYNQMRSTTYNKQPINVKFEPLGSSSAFM